MKQWFFLITIWLCQFCFASPIQDRQIDPTALSELAVALGIPKDADIIAESQKKWLRQSGTERWEMNELTSDERNYLFNWAKEQGIYTAWEPSSATYDKALILGATTPYMQARLNHLAQLWNRGIRFNEIVWLTGDRPLDPRIDKMTDRCANESEAAHLIWEEANLPDEMRSLPVVYVAVPMTTSKRPNTEDTLVAWLKIAPEPCKALFISDQPFCGYQFSVVKATLPEAFLFDVSGRSADPTSHPAAAAITLDSIARWIYQENLIANSK